MCSTDLFRGPWYVMASESDEARHGKSIRYCQQAGRWASIIALRGAQSGRLNSESTEFGSITILRDMSPEEYGAGQYGLVHRPD